MPIERHPSNPQEVREANCAGETFKPEDCNFADHNFQCQANFRLAIFEGFADFSNTKFNGEVDFSEATFKNGASFEGAIFDRGHVFFNYAMFLNGGVVSFDGAIFSNGDFVSFESATFSNGDFVSFDSATFSNKGSVIFDNATFSNGGVVSFYNATFSNGGVVSFYSATFSNGDFVSFDSATFSNSGYVTFRNVTFNNDGAKHFHSLIWANKSYLDFLIKELPEKTDFKFTENLFLSGGNIDFRNVRFPGKGSVMFHRCHFANTPTVDFSRSLFRQGVFEGGEIKWLKKLLGKNERDKPTLEKILEKRGVPLPEWVEDITIPTYTRVFDDGVKVKWNNLTTESAKNLTFRMVNLSGSIFDGVTLKHIELNAPSWEIQDGRYILRAEKDLWGKTTGFGKLKAGDDEASFREELRNVANQYTQLKSNLEGYRDFRTAGDFHYGEQEILRYGYPWLEKEISISERILRAFFHLSSGYGEKPFRAFVAALSLIFLLTVFSLFAQNSMGVHLKEIWGENEAHTHIAHFVKTMGHILSPFWKSAQIKDISDSNWGYYIYLFFAKIAIYAQSTMLVLAIRRRFKR